MFKTGDEAFASGLSIIDSTNGEKKKRKGRKNNKVDPKNICYYCKELGH